MSDGQGEPHFEELLDWLEGRLSPAEIERMAARVASGSRSTRATVEWIRAFLRLSEAIKGCSSPTETPHPSTQKYISPRTELN